MLVKALWNSGFNLIFLIGFDQGMTRIAMTKKAEPGVDNFQALDAGQDLWNSTLSFLCSFLASNLT